MVLACERNRPFNHMCKYGNHIFMNLVKARDGVVPVCVCVSVCAVYKGQAGRLVRGLGGDFHIARGRVGTVPTPGTMGAR